MHMLSIQMLERDSSNMTRRKFMGRMEIYLVQIRLIAPYAKLFKIAKKLELFCDL